MNSEKRLSYQAGITRSPSDFLCQDGELAECVNLTTDNEELKVVGDPKEVGSIQAGYKLVFVHKLPDGSRHYILKDTSNHLYWTDVAGNDYSGLGIIVSASFGANQIQAIGKTLIVSTPSGMMYSVWQGSAYKTFGEIPDAKLGFIMCKIQGTSTSGNFYNSNNNIRTTMTGSFFDTDRNGNVIIASDHMEEFDTAVTGAYAKNKKLVCQKKGFCEPFFVRYAVELYDNSYIHISQPILMLPSMTENSHGFNVNVGEDTDTFTLQTDFCHLYYYYREENPFEGMEDIVKGIAIFVSDAIPIYDTSVKQKLEDNNYNNAWTVDGVWSDGVPSVASDRRCMVYQYKPPYTHYLMLANRPYSEICKDIRSTAIFYKLCNIDPSVGQSSVNYSLSDKIDTHTLENLTNQTRLKYDDNFSRSHLSCTMLYSYNSRINVAGIIRSVFEGFDLFQPLLELVNNSGTVIVVRIKSASGVLYAKKTIDITYTDPTWWFYYPDPRADWVTMYDVMGNVILDTKLEQHPGLNGAFYFRGMPAVTHGRRALYDNIIINNSGGTLPQNVAAGGSESLVNQLATSEVNNPWIFNTYTTIGNGKVLAMSTLTTALSQGQFGQYPLIVFCDDGISAMGIDNEGAPHDINPMSRDVLQEGTQPLQTDGAVFFVSKKGLMVIDSKGIRCVSEQLRGRAFDTADIEKMTAESLEAVPDGMEWEDLLDSISGSAVFQSFFDSRFSMAYDYIDSRILLLNSGYRYCWVLSIKDGSFSKVMLPASIQSVVNAYPDYLMQSANGGHSTKIYSLYRKDQEETLTTRKGGLLVTRPIKFAGPAGIVSLRELKNVGFWNEEQGSCVKTELFVSHDLQQWYPISSRFGAGAKYFRIALYVRLLPTERLSGTILTIQDRRNNNLR